MKQSFGFASLFFQNNGVIVLHALEFRVVDHIDLRVFGNQRLALLLLCLGVRFAMWYRPTAPLDAAAAPKSLR